ncbi:unnamed protein product [Mytilus edulis]|uniref:B box-type domain-containing protein n=1 Tax=Mytilus edulis TaxID=6550 RepID=A0A8S3RD83_MYTED|nr:unnamed protein product [Mytilus edulis]
MEKTISLFLQNLPTSMATNTSVCSICDLRHITSSSKHWCPECEEALCSDCIEHHSLSRATRSHKTIPISQYQSLPTFVTDIQQFCIYHNEKYQQYCMTHESPICYKCIKEHGKCSEVIPLEDVISEVKSSELFRDLEQSLRDVLENIKRIRDDRENNAKLDQEQEIKLCSTEFENITKYASDLQTFLGMREIKSKVTNNESRLMSMIANKSLKNVDMQLTIDDKIQDLLTSVKKFGSIMIKESPSAYTNIISRKTRQAQISVPHRMISINSISVDFTQKLNTACKWLTGCTRTRKGWFIFTDYIASYEKLVIINAEGKTEYTIKLSNPYSVYDLEFINDNIVAVTTGETYRPGRYTGVSLVDLTERKDLHVISFKDYSITTIPNTVSLEFSSVSTHADKILYTNAKENKVYCCLYDGTPVWEFHDESVLKVPAGITVDDKGNVFVVGRESCNVLILSPDGKQYKQILNKENDLNNPYAIFFDKLRNQLLVANNSSVAFLYKILYF